MKTISKIAILTGVGLLFAGCSGSTPNTPESLPLNNQKRVVYKAKGNNLYYAMPSNAKGGVELNAKSAEFNRFLSGGLLKCKKNYSYISTAYGQKKWGEALSAYTTIVTPEEGLKFQKNPTLYVPEKDSKELRHLVEVGTKLARTGQTACLPPMTKQQVKQHKAYVAQQKKINNDPRVVAARIQANATASAAMMQQTTAMQQQRSYDDTQALLQQQNANMQMQQRINETNAFRQKLNPQKVDVDVYLH